MVQQAGFFQRSFYFFPVLLCFCLPFGSLFLSAIVSLWTLSSFFNWRNLQLRSGFGTKHSWAMPLFFVLTLLSAFWSHNGREASTAIEVKLGFLVFPYLLFGFKWPVEILKRCWVAFVSGCFFACLYLIVRASWYASNGQPDYFYYTLFSDFIHASYFAMYLTTAIAIVILYYPLWFAQQTSHLYLAYGFVAVFILCIFLCASKLGIIGFFVTLPLIVISRFKIPITIKTSLWMLALLVICIVLTTFLFPSVFDRLRSITEVQHETIDKTSVESTRVRVLIWKEAIGLIRANPWMGVGVGDANDALYAAYEKEGLTGALSHKFNAHNQYFQTCIGMGLPGFMLLCLLTFWQIVVAIQKKNPLHLVFAILIVLNFLVESMLQTAAGVLYFGFFYAFFNAPNAKELQT